MITKHKYSLAFVFILTLLSPFVFLLLEKKQNNFSSCISYQQGTLPIILSVPHDGTLEPTGVPERVNSAKSATFSKQRDEYTEDVSHLVALEIEKLTGKKPFVVVNCLSRKYVDVNRPKDQAFESSYGEQVYKQYHKTIQQARSEILSHYANGLLLDIHGQSAQPADVYIMTKKGKSMQKLTSVFGEDVLDGTKSIGMLLVKDGYVVSGISDFIQTDWVRKIKGKQVEKIMLPKENPSLFEDGSYTIGVNGSQNNNGIDAMELEIHARIRLDTKEREKFAKNLAKALVIFTHDYLLEK